MLKWLTHRAAEAETAMRHVEVDAREVTVVGRVDGLVLLLGRRPMTATALSPAAARALLWFLLKWWTRTCWLGLRGWLLARAIRGPRRG